MVIGNLIPFSQFVIWILIGYQWLSIFLRSFLALCIRINDFFIFKLVNWFVQFLVVYVFLRHYFLLLSSGGLSLLWLLLFKFSRLWCKSFCKVSFVINHLWFYIYVFCDIMADFIKFIIFCVCIEKGLLHHA